MEIKELEFDGTKILDYLPKKPNIAEFAKKIGITRQAMHDIVKGRRKPSADVAVKIVSVLNIPITKLSNKNLNSLSANS